MICDELKGLAICIHGFSSVLRLKNKQLNFFRTALICIDKHTAIINLSNGRNIFDKVQFKYVIKMQDHVCVNCLPLRNSFCLL